MRNPSDLPPSGPGGQPPFRIPQLKFGRPSKGRFLVSIIVGLLLVLAFSARSLSTFFVNILWFRGLGQSDVYFGVLSAKVQLVAVFTLGFAIVAWINLFITDRLAPLVLPHTSEDRAILRVQQAISKRRGTIRAGVALGLGLIAGLPAATQWQEWILFRHRQAFADGDPQFKANVGFYIFRLPFAEFVVNWAFGALIFIVLLVLFAHFINGGIRPQARTNRMTPQSKVHISVLLAAAALLRATGYWLARFDLTRSQRGVVQGALYTDVNAQLPAINLMILVSVAVAALLLWNVRQRGWRIPVLAVGLWVVVAVTAGTLYPTLVQRFVVQPNVSTRELPFIERNIGATKAALGLENVERKQISFGEVNIEEAKANDLPLRDVRQLDAVQMRNRFGLDQGLTSFYAVRDLDVDRYSIDGRMQQVMVASRELNTAGIPNRTWVSRHLIYTHGCGVIAAPASVVTSDGRPSYVDLKVTKPQLYFGDQLDGYSVVNTDQDEQACPSTTAGEYTGERGVRVDSVLRRLALAINFGEYNLFGSRLITEDSQLLWVRDVRERVQKIAPFLHFDSDPYPVVVKGEVKWIIDAYTTTDRYPYAQNANTGQLTANSGLAHSFNYVRNSVKAVVDAYSGDVTMYVVDTKDPIIRAWRSAFPKLFTPKSEAPEELVAHFRYPEDLFRVQSNVFGKYQFDEANLFFNRDAAWSVAQAPPSEPEGATSAPAVATGPGTLQVDSVDVADANVLRFTPYYTIFHAPDGSGDAGTFSMLRPYVPFSSDDSRKELRAMMVVSSDPDTYGKITVYEMSTPLPPGPATIAAEFESDPVVSEIITPLDLRGSRVTYGDLQIVPIAKGVVYLRPMFVQPQDADAKQVFVRKILGWYNGRTVIADSVTQAVSRLLPGFTTNLGDRVGSATSASTVPATTIPEGSAPSPSTTAPMSTSENGSPRQLLAKADELFAEADAALAQTPPDFATYQAKQSQARDLVQRALQLLNG